MIPTGIFASQTLPSAIYNALYVVLDSTSLTGAEISIKDRLETYHNCSVTPISDETAVPDVSGYDFIIVGKVDSATLGTKYDTAAKPLMLLTSENYDELDISGANGTTRASQTAINIVDNTDYITTGFALGEVTISAGERLAGTTNAAAFGDDTVKLAAFSGDAVTTSLCLAYVKSGERMYFDVPAPDLRIIAPFNESGVSLLNTFGLALFDNCINALINPSLLT